MNENIKLYNGDCLDIMKTFESEIIDLTVTSPPYDNLRTYDGSLNDWSFGKFQEIAKELFRITKQCGVVVWIVGDATIKGSETGTSFKQALYFKEIGFNLHDTMIYIKDVCPFPDTNRYYQNFEYMFVFSKGKPKTTNLLKDRVNKSFGRKVSGTSRNKDGSTSPKECLDNEIKEYGIRFNSWLVSDGKRQGLHPAPFPERLANDHIVSWSNKGNTVFDPFTGSGTTGKMSVLNNREFIGIERVKNYFDIAEKRIKEASEKKEDVIF